MQETRSSLLDRVRDPADADGWREFVALYEPLILSYARSKGLAEDDARDVAQNVFVALLRALPTFQLDRARGRFRTWLWQVTANALADWARGRRRQADAEAELRQRPAEGASPAGEPDAAWLAAHRQRVLDFVLERTREEAQPRTWACFEQHLLLGRPSAEVAAELGLTANAVYVNASRLLARVREQCTAYLEDLDDGGDRLPG
jgi:RNA polymerase sigma-70 factor (ECF subfamily)